MKCNLEEELNRDVVSREIIDKVVEIVRRELKFLIKNNILMTPVNYTNWFKVFCYIVENNKNLSDVQVFSLYEQLVDKKMNVPNGHAIGIVDRDKVADTLERIADAIDEKLLEAIETVYSHQENLTTHTDRIEKEAKELQVEDKFQIILNELNILKSQNKSLIEKLEHYHQEISKLNTEIKIAKEEASIDFLTGLVNRRSFERALNDLLKEVRDKDYTFSLIIFDIDDFKKVNDTYGHFVGDMVLKEVSTILRTFLRANTIIARIGGEEFGIILPNVEIENAIKVAQRIRNVIENREVKYNNHIIKFTASFGITQSKKDDEPVSIFDRADKALYKAKKEGKNLVVAI